jgi:RES domain-containing protein
MKVAGHIRYETLHDRLQEEPQLFRPWNGLAYRVTTLDYPNPRSILLGQGSFLYGGRWNAIGSFRAVYGSTEDTVAVAESRATADYANVPTPFRAPRLLVAIEFSLQAVLNLCDPAVLQNFGCKAEELWAEDWRKVQERGVESFTQVIGRAVFANGGEGLLAPSARVNKGVNVVYVPENLRSGSRAQVLESEKLDRIRLA